MMMKMPYYVIHKQEMDEILEELKLALEKCWGNYIIGYSYKTNTLPWLISYFNAKGCYAEVASDDELALTGLVGVDHKRIIYNGPIKTKESFINTLLNGGYVNIDTQREIDWLDDLPEGHYNIGVRVNYDVERMCPNQSQCGDEGGRFGFCYENGAFAQTIEKINQKGHKVSGLHLHVSSKSRGVEIYRSIAQLACEIATRFHLDLDFVDVGGGFFGGLPAKPSFHEYISQITRILKTRFNRERTKLIVEPGMALIGSPVSYVTSVIDVKDTTYNRFVVTDGSRTNIDPFMRKSNYFYEVFSREHAQIIKKQIICGYTCIENDRLFVLKDAPELAVGDEIVYHRVGAYTMCLTPLFVKYFPDVYVEDEGALRKVRDAWTPREYIQNASFY